MLLKKIKQIPFMPLIIAAFFLGLTPFSPEPHLLEKSRMLLQGSLLQPLDIFDLIMHATPTLLLILRVITHFMFRENKKT